MVEAETEPVPEQCGVEQKRGQEQRGVKLWDCEATLLACEDKKERRRPTETRLQKAW